MEKVRVQILINQDNYSWLMEEAVGRHHKNLSQTVNELLKNYQILMRSLDKERERAEREMKAKQEVAQMAAIYRAKVVEWYELVIFVGNADATITQHLKFAGNIDYF